MPDGNRSVAAGTSPRPGSPGGQAGVPPADRARVGEWARGGWGIGCRCRCHLGPPPPGDPWSLQAPPGPCDLPASLEAWRAMELEGLQAEVKRAERSLEILRMRIRMLGGQDPASEAGLP